MEADGTIGPAVRDGRRGLMLRNYLVTALRNLERNRLYAAISILGLAVAFAAAMLVGLYVRDEYSFEHFISGYQRVYRLEMEKVMPGQKPQPMGGAVSTAAASIALDFPEVEGAVRLALSSQWVGQGEAKSWERVAWTDPDFFKVMPFPVLAGDPVAALHDPDGLVLTRQAARKFFGEDAPIGRTLLVQEVHGADSGSPPHPMVVRAVLKDIPSATHLEQFKIYASGRAPWSRLTRQEGPLSIWDTYVRLPPGVPADRVAAGLPAFAARHYADHMDWRFRLEPLKDLHLTPETRAVDAGIAAVGALILVVAAINFVTLMTAYATRRAVEIGVRKVAGARRSQLIIQFLGETLIQVLLAVVIGVAIVELALPLANAFLRRTITFDWFDDPTLAAAILGVALLTTLIAGLYPALVLSGFRPAIALKGKGGQASGPGRVRQGLVVVQFAVLICLTIVGVTIWRQTSFTIDNLKQLNVDQIVYFVDCDRPFQQELAKLPGVTGVSCISEPAADSSPFKTFVSDPARGAIGIGAAAAGVGFFEMHGLQPLAGRFFSNDHGEDMVLDRAGAAPESQPSVVLNESGARQLGFKSPRDAVGRIISWKRTPAASPTANGAPFRSSQIIGVVKDFALQSMKHRIEPTMYFVDPAQGILFAKLKKQTMPQTLSAIDGLYRRLGHARPLEREFLSTTRLYVYRDEEVQGAIVGGCAGLAIIIASFGLFAMAAFTAERRTKEIGVRKAMGAGAPDVVRLLLWQFTRPVLWANLLAWPLAFWAADRWLQGFAYRVSLPPWLFLSASALAMLIALATVGAQAWLAARDTPASALRYE